MVACIGDVVKDLNLPTQHRDHSIDAAIVIQVAEGGATMNRFHLEIRSRRRTYVLKLSVSKIAKDRTWLRIFSAGGQYADVVENVGACDEQILPTVIVEIIDSVT